MRSGPVSEAYGCNPPRDRNLASNFKVQTLWMWEPWQLIDDVRLYRPLRDRLASRMLSPRKHVRTQRLYLSSSIWSAAHLLDLCFLYFGSLGGPGGSRDHSKRWGGLAPHLLTWFLGPPGPSRPPKSVSRDWGAAKSQTKLQLGFLRIECSSQTTLACPQTPASLTRHQ